MKRFLLMSIALSIFLAAAGAVQANSWFNPDWRYRRAVVITNPCGEEVTGYQVQVTLDNSFDFSHAPSEGSELRVTDSDGETPIPFWVEEWDAIGESASIWVKVPSIPTGGTTIYLYYGNPSPPGPQFVEVPPVGPWDKHPDNPIVPIDDPGGGSSLLAENMVYDEVTEHYWLVFAAYRGGSKVGLAWSDDPGNPNAWHWYGIVVNSANAPHLIEHNGIWYIFYADRGHGGAPYPISVSKSTTGVAGPYVYDTLDNPVLVPTETWETYRVDEPYVFQRIDGKWILMYMGDQGGTTELIGYAEADDIMGPYTKFAGNPCIPFGTLGSIDAGTVADAWVVEFHGTYYIGYTVSPTKSSPWRTSYVTTDDWVTFTKSNEIILDLGGPGDPDQYNAFRGAVTRFDNTYYFPYTGRPAGGSYVMCIATQPAYMLEEINTCEEVFEFCDTFDVDGDLSKWTVQYYGSGHTVGVSGGVLAITAQAGTSSYGYVQMRGDVAIGTETLLETYARHQDAGLDCDPDSDTENAAEVGYKPGDFGWGNVIRIMDYPYTANYTVQSAASGSNSDYIQTDLSLGTDWQEYSIDRDQLGYAYFEVRGIWSSISLGPPNVPTISLYPWLMSYAEPCAGSTDFEVDWIHVRKWCGQDAESAVGSEEAQVIEVDIDIKPGSYPNCFNINGHGVIPVAILGSADLDVTQIDVSSLNFAGLQVRVKGNDKPQCSIEDVSGDFTFPEGAPDGFDDLVCQFVDDAVAWLSGDGTATVTGQLLDSTPITGMDEICLRPE